MSVLYLHQKYWLSSQHSLSGHKIIPQQVYQLWKLGEDWSNIFWDIWGGMLTFCCIVSNVTISNVLISDVSGPTFTKFVYSVVESSSILFCFVHDRISELRIHHTMHWQVLSVRHSMQDVHFSTILATCFVRRQWRMSVVARWLMNGQQESVSTQFISALAAPVKQLPLSCLTFFCFAVYISLTCIWKLWV